MSSANINIVKKGFKCLRCLHEWIARKAGRPTWCPKCHHPKWDERQTDYQDLSIPCMKYYEKPKNKCGNYIRTPEFRKALSESSKGRKPWNTNKTLSEEHKQKLSNAHKGKVPWNKGKKGVQISWAKGKTKATDPRIRWSNKDSIRTPEWRKNQSKAWDYDKHVTEESREKQRIARLSQVFPKKDSKPEKLMQLALEMEGIKFDRHKKLIGQPDIFIEPNLCIFVDGDYWHCNPIRFKADQIVYGGLKVSEIWEYDNAITHSLSEQGYVVMRFWTSFIKKSENKWATHVINTIKAYVIRHQRSHYEILINKSILNRNR